MRPSPVLLVPGVPDNLIVSPGIRTIWIPDTALDRLAELVRAANDRPAEADFFRGVVVGLYFAGRMAFVCRLNRFVPVARSSLQSV